MTLPALTWPESRRLDTGWRLLLTPPDAHATPAGLEGAFVPAIVPGTVAQALEAAGLFDRGAPAPLDDRDAWYMTRLSEAPGAALLRFDGLATFAEVFLNGTPLLSSDSMFHRHDCPVHLTGADELAICFRALGPKLSRKLKRARWRTRLIAQAGLRGVRTTLLGSMPGWCPEIHPVGPWRPVHLLRSALASLTHVEITARLDAEGTGRLCVRFDLDGPPRPLQIRCAGFEASVTWPEAGHAEANLSLPHVAPWWPRSHGQPALHEVDLIDGNRTLTIGRTGFRRIAVDRQADGDGFQLVVNGVPVFCRGAVWTSADIVSLPGERADYAPWLRLAAEAGMNMLRIGGTMAYETPDFFSLCDELGIMVWQDAMLANFDYPADDPVFIDSLRREIETLLSVTRASPSLAVVCGGSEVYQQAAMMGLPPSAWAGAVSETHLPHWVSAIREDVVYVPNSPSGGVMPFFPGAGIAHYYGVGAYCRPLEDARRANVRFAAECLAFSHVPEEETLEAALPVPPVHDPRWKARVPRDRDASWDFEDIREHYLALLYDVDPQRLRREDIGLYMALSRTVTAEVIEATFAEWRRTGSACGGALVWTFQDLMAGAGWGLVDARGVPKLAWHGARRAFRPLQLLLIDEGTNGLDVHIVNDTAQERTLRLDLTCLRGGHRRVVGGERIVTVAPRGRLKIAATDLFGAFFDTTYAYRFSAPQHDVSVAALSDAESGAFLCDAFHFPRGRKAALQDADLSAALVETETGFALDIASDRFAQSVHIRADGFLASDNGFHLPPGRTRRITLTPLRPGADPRPAGEVSALSGSVSVRF